MRLAAPLLALLSAVALPATAAAAMKSQPVEWSVDGEAYSGWLVYDDEDDDRRPGLVMVPNWMGVTDDALERAKAVAGDDYVVLVADVYGKGRQPKDSGEAGKLAGALRGDDRGALRARMQAALETLKAQAGEAPLDAGRIGAFGFCFGGSAVLELARAGADLAGVVSLHGGLAPGAQSPTASKIASPVLVLNGADDKAVSDADIAAFEQEMDAAGADWQFVDFSGAVHCFAEPSAGSDPASNCRYDARAAKRAYAMMDGFFEEAFGED
jgi:dienelactone hydrolase